MKIKQEKGQRFDHITLRDTEEYQASGHIEINGDEFKVVFTDWKSAELRERFGDAIEGPSDETLNRFIHELLHDALILELTKALN
jgi:hypothetical protein